MKRNDTSVIHVGGVAVGGNHPVTVQSMCNTKTHDVEATLRQINAFAAAGCDIVRLAVPDMEAAKAISAIKERSPLPIVADIHFDYKLALEAAERGVDKIRINPGNIGSDDNVKAVAKICSQKNIPIRIGVNAGSLDPKMLEKYGHPTPEALVESARKEIALLNRYDFNDVCLSLKTSSVPLTIAAYRLASEEFSCPLHVGVTETGTVKNGTILSAVGIGTLLNEGIGNTIRVSLTSDPVEEVRTGISILKACGLREGGIRFISCPTCGRTEINLIALAEEVERRLAGIDKNITVAVMGCVVNGPGEAREADYGIAGGKDCGILFKKGVVVRRVPEDQLCDALLELIMKDE